MQEAGNYFQKPGKVSFTSHKDEESLRGKSCLQCDFIHLLAIASLNSFPFFLN